MTVLAAVTAKENPSACHSPRHRPWAKKVERQQPLENVDKIPTQSVVVKLSMLTLRKNQMKVWRRAWKTIELVFRYKKPKINLQLL